MPPSAAEPEQAGVPGQSLATVAAILFLANLLVAPGLAFVVLAWLWRQRRHTAPPLARSHLDQAFFVSLWGGLLIVVACSAILMLGGLHGMWTWVAVILYFTCIHSTLIIFGCIGLAHAMAGKAYRYPLIGVGRG